jgi:transcriptional regulator with XRE-family HTH domain
MTHSISTFSRWLTAQMTERGWSQSDLARASGLTRQVISYYLTGKTRTPDPDALHALAAGLRLPPEAVFRAAGILAPTSEDPWVEEMSHKLSRLAPNLRETAGRLIDALADQEEADQKARLFKPKKAAK